MDIRECPGFLKFAHIIAFPRAVSNFRRRFAIRHFFTLLLRGPYIRPVFYDIASLSLSSFSLYSAGDV